MHSAKRLRQSSSDALQDMASGEELSLYGSGPNNAESSQVDYLLLCEMPYALIHISLLPYFLPRNEERKSRPHLN